jgi:hypothetical protein
MAMAFVLQLRQATGVTLDLVASTIACQYNADIAAAVSSLQMHQCRALVLVAVPVAMA